MNFRLNHSLPRGSSVFDDELLSTASGESELSWFWAFSDLRTRRQFHAFLRKRTSSVFLFAATALIACVLLPVLLLFLVEDVRGSTAGRATLSVVCACCALSCVVCGCLLLAQHNPALAQCLLSLCSSPSLSSVLSLPSLLSTKETDRSTRRVTVYSDTDRERERELETRCKLEQSFRSSRSPSSAASAAPTTSAFPFLCRFREETLTYDLSLLFFVLCQATLLLLFLRRAVLVDACASDSASTTDCLSEDARFFATLSLAALSLTAPLLVFVNLPETCVGSVWALLALSLLMVALPVIALRQLMLLLFVLPWTLICALTVLDIHRRNVLMFCTHSRLVETLRERAKQEESNRALEMRHMIANVAHDLKTPLASFTQGLDFIQRELDDFLRETIALSPFLPQDCRTCSARSAFAQSIETCLHSIRDTHAFMLMAVNRCVDFTKASKGLALVPRFETVSLRDALDLPLSCMRNMQSRIAISLADIPESVCSHVITDKQWLQENLLCLLSNAVKYSSGEVCVSLRLETVYRSSRREKDREKKKIIDEKDAQNNERDNETRRSQDQDSISLDRFFFSSPAKVFPARESAATLCESNKSIKSETENDVKSENSSDRIHDDAERDAVSAARETREMLRFEIEDAGIGVPSHLAGSLFSPFKQAQRLAGGTGLGLYSLAKRIEAMHGRYGVRGRRDGRQGSLFWFSIPYRPDTLAAQMDASLSSSALADDFSQSVKRCESSDGASSAAMTRCASSSLSLSVCSARRPSASLSLPLSQSLSSSQRSLEILLVDDSPAIIKMTCMLLRKLGHRVYTADHGMAAVRTVSDRWAREGRCFDVVLMDLQMPVMDGLEATRRIRELENPVAEKQSEADDVISAIITPLPRQVLIGTSANSDDATVSAAHIAGVDAFIAKPFNASTFAAVLASLSQEIDRPLSSE